jgi:hypothetical protein
LQTGLKSHLPGTVELDQNLYFQHLTAILEFMYAGEVNVAQDQSEREVLMRYMKSCPQMVYTMKKNCNL